MPAKRIFSFCPQPDISVIVPTLDGDRDGNVEKLVQQLKDQTFQSIEIILSIGESPNGHARNVGVEIAQGKWLVLIDDDVTVDQNDLLERLIEPFEQRQDIGMTGPSQLIPLDANRFQHWCGKQVPRSYAPVVDEMTDSDMVSHMCLAIPRDLYHEVGRESDWLLAGTDPDLRHRVRQAGYRIVVMPQSWAYHPAPDNLKSMIKFAFKKGSYSAWQYRFARDLMYDAPDGHTGEFEAQTTLVYRMRRKALRLVKEAVTFRLLGLLHDLVYITGYLYGLIKKW